MSEFETSSAFEVDSGRIHVYSTIFQWIVLLAVLSGWASATLVTRLLLVHSLAEPDTLMALRYTISALGTGLLGLFLNRGRGTLPWKTTYLWGGLLIAIQAILFGIASKLAEASITGLCFFGCASLTASLIGLFLKRRSSVLQLLGIAFGLIGLVTVMRPSGDVNTGALLAALGGLAWGGYVLWSKYGMPTGWVAGLKATSRTMTIGACISWLFAIIFEPHGLFVLDGRAWCAVLYMGLIPQALGFVVFGWLAARLNHVQLGVSQFGTPVLVVIGGMTLLGESSTWTLWLGLGFVILGMLMASRNPKSVTSTNHEL